MSTTRVGWLVGWAAVTLLAGRGEAAGEPWRAAEQPELKQALEKAPLLKTESLGEPARGVNVWERWMVPNLDGKSWDVLQIYFKEYYGPTWLCAVDLGTGQVKKQRLPDGHQFYLSGRALGFDGKYYVATPSRHTWSMGLFVYDPASNTMEDRGEIVPGLGGEVRPLAVGPDGRIYGTGTRGNQVGLYIYDPKLGKVVKDFGPVGPSHPNGAWSRYVMGVDDTHAYIASGMVPAWYLVAVNLTTGEEKVLLESPTERVMDILEQFPGAYARVPQGGGAPFKEYWLYHGEAIAKTGDVPPWPPRESPWDKGSKTRPEVYYDQIDPDAEGRATLWYRPREDARAEKRPRGDAAARKTPESRGWKSIGLEGVETYPHRLNPLSLLPDGRLYGTGDDYVGSFLFDPKGDKTTYLGPRVGLAPYTTIVCGGKLYFSGYAGGPLVVYDPGQPWTLGKGGPPGQPAPGPDAPASNPRRIGEFGATRVAIMHSSAMGADGKIYFGGFGERNYTGGGFGWYDPKTGKLDGFWRPLSGYTVHWIAPALGGRVIAISTSRAADELSKHQAPAEARLFLYDVAEGKIVREIVPIAKARSTGLVIEAAPGRLLGLTTERERADRSILYGVDVASGEVLFRKALPSPVSTDAYWPHWVDPSYEYESLTRGPDGFIWTYLKDVLVRIDPKDAGVHVVGRIAPVGYPTFVGNDVYLSGPEQLRRIRNIVPSVNLPAFGPEQETWLRRKLLPAEEAKGMMGAFLERQLKPLPVPETREAWLARRDALRREVLAVLGIDDLMPPKWDLALKSKGTLKRQGYRIEKITFESYPGMAIPAVVYVPEGTSGRVPGIVSISGHTPASKAADYVQQRNVNLALRGCVVLAYDYYGYGERKTGDDPNHPIGANTHGIRSFSFTRRTATAIEVLDAVRAIDALSARPEVDPERIGFTGESGGSNSTYWAAAVDPRVCLVVPVSSVTTFDYWIRTDCNWDWHQRPPGIRRIADIGTLLALHAPRPLMIISSRRGTDDQEFPLTEAEKSYQWARHVYRLLAAEDAAGHYESTTAHGYQQDKREQLYRAVERWLRPPFPKGEKELPAKVESAADLRCGLPEKNLTLRDVYAEWLKPLPRLSQPADPAALRAVLRERLGWPQPLPDVKAEKVGAEEKGPWEAEFWVVEPEPGIRLPAVRIGRHGAAGPIALVPGRDSRAVARALEAGRQVLALDLRGTGEIAPAAGNVRNWAWFAGRPWPGLWALDLVQAARFCRERLSAPTVVVEAENDYGWPALLAAAAAADLIPSGSVFIPRATLRDELRTGGDHALADVPGLLERLDVLQLCELWPGGHVTVKR